MKKFLILSISILLIVSLVTGCGAKPAAQPEQPLKVGVTAGPHEQVAEKVKEIAAANGLQIELVVFTDYVQPNIQLFEKQLDVNIFQHQPYLDQFNTDHKMDLVTVASAVNFPMGAYSKTLKSLDELNDGDQVSLPNDPTNGARALILLESANVIKLREGAGIKVTLKDIVENPKNIKFIELDAPMVARSLDDVNAAVINTNFAIEAGFVPTKDAIFLEPKDSPWVNVIVTRPDLQEDPRIKKLVESYHTDEVKQFIDATFEGSVVPGF